MSIYFDGLNDNQISAVKTTEGYVRVNAGPGTGKTKVLTNRYAYLCSELGVSSKHILSITFTNKAALEMKRRINSLMPDNDGCWIGTFHSICKKILNYDINLLNFPANFKVIDEDDQKTLLREIYRDNNLNMRDGTFGKVLKEIHHYKLSLEYIPYLTNPHFSDDFPYLSECGTFGLIIQEYLKSQRRNFYLDFSDLIFFVLYLLNTNQDFREKWQKVFEYIQVDEFQDVSLSQYSLVSILSGYHKNLFIVGDVDQTIYSWRGANPSFFLDFDKQFENVTTITLSTNYRSCSPILQVSNSLIVHNTERLPKELIPTRTITHNVIYYHAKTRKEECEWIVNKILEHHKNGIPYDKIAILYRANQQSRPIEEQLLIKNMPYKIYGGQAFYKREEIKDILAYMQMLVNDDDISFLRTVNKPARGIGPKRIDVLRKYANIHNVSLFNALKNNYTNSLFNSLQIKSYIDTIEKGRSLIKASDFNLLNIVDFLLKDSGYEEMLMTDGNQDRLDNLAEFKKGVFDYVQALNGEPESLSDYMNDITLLTSLDENNKQESVKMMTVHTAKGLEFNCVFVSHLNETFFPSCRVSNKDEMEEERRIAYVAYTRAKDYLYLTNSHYLSNETEPLYPSRFIFNIEDNLLKKEGFPYSEQYLTFAQSYIHLIDMKLDGNNINNEMKIGDTVNHKLFGEGKITAINYNELTILFNDAKIRTISNLETLIL